MGQVPPHLDSSPLAWIDLPKGMVTRREPQEHAVGGAESFDLVIYGGTSAAVLAAVQARHMGKSVVLVSPDRHLGGMSSSGPGFTDVGDPSVIGGLARDFYRRIWQHYQRPGAWRWQGRADYANKGQDVPAIDAKCAVQDVDYLTLRQRRLDSGQVLSPLSHAHRGGRIHCRTRIAGP